MKVNGDHQLFGVLDSQLGYQHSSKYLLLFSTEERNSYWVGTTWGWVNDNRIFIFGNESFKWESKIQCDATGRRCSLMISHQQLWWWWWWWWWEREREREIGRRFSIWIHRAARTRSRDSSRFVFGHALSGARTAGNRCV